MDKEKYYTPSIEEFHVGFEYEALWGLENVNPEWSKEVFKKNQKADDTEDIVRVKKLDREDIEQLGFNLFTDVNYDTYRKRTDGNTHFIHISKGKTTITRQVGNGGDTIFTGTIRNKSELAVILKQIGAL